MKVHTGQAEIGVVIQARVSRGTGRLSEVRQILEVNRKQALLKNREIKHDIKAWQGSKAH